MNIALNVKILIILTKEIVILHAPLLILRYRIFAKSVCWDVLIAYLKINARIVHLICFYKIINVYRTVLYLLLKTGIIALLVIILV